MCPLPNVSSFQVVEFTQKSPSAASLKERKKKKNQPLFLKSGLFAQSKFSFLADKAADGGTTKQDLDKVRGAFSVAGCSLRSAY